MRILLLALLMILHSSVSAIDCVPDGSELERAYCAALDAQRAERELDAALAGARGRAAADPNAVEALEAAHVAWLAFRDAALAAAFPCYHDDPSVCFGTDRARKFEQFRARLARERIAHLEIDWTTQ